MIKEKRTIEVILAKLAENEKKNLVLKINFNYEFIIDSICLHGDFTNI